MQKVLFPREDNFQTEFKLAFFIINDRNSTPANRISVFKSEEHLALFNLFSREKNIDRILKIISKMNLRYIEFNKWYIN